MEALQTGAYKPSEDLLEELQDMLLSNNMQLLSQGLRHMFIDFL
jgi:hypothetical protein